MRTATRALIVTVLLVAASGPAMPDSGPENPARGALDVPSREAAVVRWALTYAPLTDALRARVATLAAKGTPEAHAELFAIGEPARRVLLALQATDAAVAERTAALRACMQDLQNEVERRDLYCDLRYLPTVGPAAADRVKRIVPVEAPSVGAVSWCLERAGSLRWEPTLDRYVLVPVWDRDQAPRRWRHRDTVTLRDTQGLVSPDSAFTAEFWVRWPQPTQQSLFGEEAWFGMSPKVSVKSERGFTFRRHHHGHGTSTLDFTGAIDSGGWWTVESAPLHLSTQWEHVAVSSDGRVVRIFRDGALVAARAIAGTRFARGIHDLALGVRPDGWSDRRANFDLRGCRVSEGARYTTGFLPPRRFDKDDATILLLDFTPGGDVLADLSGGGHDATGEGRWIPPHDPAALGAALAAFGGTPGAVVVAEAELGGRTGQWYVYDRAQFSEGVNLEIWTDQDPGPEGYVATVPFRVPHAGPWRLHMVGGGLHRVGQQFSPFAWQVDDGPWTPVLGSKLALYGLLGRSDLDLSPLGVEHLSEGEHVFRIRLLSRRRTPDRRWSIWMDALVLQATAPVATTTRDR